MLFCVKGVAESFLRERIFEPLFFEDLNECNLTEWIIYSGNALNL